VPGKTQIQPIVSFRIRTVRTYYPQRQPPRIVSLPAPMVVISRPGKQVIRAGDRIRGQRMVIPGATITNFVPIVVRGPARFIRQPYPYRAAVKVISPTASTTVVMSRPPRQVRIPTPSLRVRTRAIVPVIQTAVLSRPARQVRTGAGVYLRRAIVLPAVTVQVPIRQPARRIYERTYYPIRRNAAAALFGPQTQNVLVKKPIIVR
jgi:hypothetical protein